MNFLTILFTSYYFIRKFRRSGNKTGSFEMSYFQSIRPLANSHVRRYVSLESIVKWSLVACRVFVKNRTCFTDSLVLGCNLKLMGFSPALVIGYLPYVQAGQYQFHSWVEVEGDVVNEDEGVCRHCIINMCLY